MSKVLDGTSLSGCHVPYDDLREWLDEVKRLGELRNVDHASCEEDIGEATEILHHSDPSPAALFDHIPGYSKGFRVLTNFFGGKRMNMSLGLPTDLNKQELSDTFYETYKNLKPLPYQTIANGPIFENVQMGDEVNVKQFPAPFWHEQDGGRYIGTGCFVITKDPDTEIVNLGTYRVMVHDDKNVGFYISPGKHGRIHRDKYFERNEAMPVAIVIGGDPLLFLMSCSDVPFNVTEYNVAGALRGKPYPVVQGKLTGLPIPAHAEIVLEGYVHPDKRLHEGPFGEWTGYYGSGDEEEPVMEVQAIYYRNNPIILGCPPSRPPDSIARFRAIMRSAMLKEEMGKAGVPDVTGVWAHEIGGNRMFLAVSIKQRYPGHARQAGHIATFCGAGNYAGKYVVVVDEDIDVSDLEEVIWALVTRSDPSESIDIIDRVWSTRLDPRIHPDKKKVSNFTNSRCIIDACRPWEWRDKFPLVNMLSPEKNKKAKEKFGWLLE
jgi:UbiD family decarboxylase